MDTDTNVQKTPDPGPPKKGFWGFLASFFPKQPTPQDHVNPSSQAPDPAEHSSDESGQAPQSGPDASQSQPEQQVSQAPQQSAPQPSQTNESTDILARPVPTIKPDHDPQPLAVPNNLEAQPIEADGTKVSPTLPTQPPAAGDPASETPEQQTQQQSVPAPETNNPASEPTRPTGPQQN